MPVLVDDDLRFEDDDGVRPSVAVNRWLRELPSSGCPAPRSAEIGEHEQQRNLDVLAAEYRNYQNGARPSGPGARDLTEYFATIDGKLSGAGAAHHACHRPPSRQAGTNAVMSLLQRVLDEPTQEPVPAVGDAHAALRRTPGLDAKIIGVFIDIEKLHVERQVSAVRHLAPHPLPHQVLDGQDAATMLDPASPAVLICKDLAECLPVMQARIFTPADRRDGDQGAEQRSFASARGPQYVGIDQAVADAHLPRLAHNAASQRADFCRAQPHGVCKTDPG